MLLIIPEFLQQKKVQLSPLLLLVTSDCMGLHPGVRGQVNTECIEWANHVMRGREHAKHTDICTHFAHGAVQKGYMRLYKIQTEFQLADLLMQKLQLQEVYQCLYGLLVDVEV
jgi:hypothetical protein